MTQAVRMLGPGQVAQAAKGLNAISDSSVAYGVAEYNSDSRSSPTDAHRHLPLKGGGRLFVNMR